MKKEFIFLFLAAAFYIFPVFWQVRNLHFRLDSDYDSAIPILTYLVESVRTKGFVPLRFPYVPGGMPLISDPLSFVLNPLITFPAIFFGVQNGLRVSIFFVALLSGATMMIFLSKFTVTGFLKTWASLLYMTSGALGARVAAGHIEKILSFPLIPLFFLFTIGPGMNWIQIVGAAFTMTLIIFSGDIYMIWFLSIFFLVIRAFHFFTKQESFLRIAFQSSTLFIFFGIFAGVKLIPFFFDVLPNMERFSEIDPFAGSIHVFLAPLVFVVPQRVLFYDRPFFQRTLGFHFNWYEYYAFISPLSFLPLSILRSIMNRRTALLTILLVTGALYGAVKYPYSPFYWLFHWIPAFDNFRVPQRIFTPMLPILILLFAWCAQKWRRKLRIEIICLLSLVWTFVMGQQTLMMAFEKPRLIEQSLVKELRKKDSDTFWVEVNRCCLQTYLIAEHIPISNYYYGWKFKNSPTKTPRYIITPKSL